MISNIPQGRLNQSKMTCIKDLVDSKLFRLPLCRGILLPNFCRQIKDKLESKEEVSELFNLIAEGVFFLVNNRQDREASSACLLKKYP